MTAPTDKKPGRMRRLLKRFWYLCLAGGLVLALLLGCTGIYLYIKATGVPLPATVIPAQNSYVFDTTGRQIGVLPAAENRKIVADNQISPVMKQAMVAAEDKNFYHERGISYSGIARAALADLRGGEGLQGGSTIEQQYAKNAYLTSARTLSRKLHDIGIALKLDKVYTKDQILGFYLNTVYFGRGAYGVEAAAKAYYGRTALQLSVVQSATLAALVNAPSSLSQPENRSALMARRNYVLANMVQLNWLDQANLLPDESKPVHFVPQHTPGIYNSLDPYTTDLAREYVAQKYGDAVLARGGLKIYTTIDWKLEQQARQAVLKNLPSPGLLGAMSVINPTTGAVVAMANSTEYGTGPGRSEFNSAARAARQVGSTMKAIVLADAVVHGISPLSVLPAPAYALVGHKRIYNDDLAPHGQLTLERAIAESNNPVNMELINGTIASPNNPSAVRPLVGDPVNPADVAQLAASLGMTDSLLPNSRPPKLDPVPELALGTSSLTTLETASAYGTFANQGAHAATYFIQRITLADGRLVEHHTLSLTPVMNPGQARVVTQVLRGVIDATDGTGQLAAIGRPAAGKTGTTDYDAWFTGYTPQLVASAWTGYANNRPLQVAGEQVFGGASAALMWRDFMKHALAGRAVENFPAASLATGRKIGLQPPPPPPARPTATASPTASPTPIPSPTPSPAPRPTSSPTPAPTSPLPPRRLPTPASPSPSETWPNEPSPTATPSVTQGPID